MEQSTNDCCDFDEDERDVIGILLELPELIAKSEISLDWGLKRRRTAESDGSSPFRSPSLRAPRPPPPSVVAMNENSMPLVVEPEEPSVKAVQATSPVTPLSLSLSESNENHECFKRNSSHNKVLGPKIEDPTSNLALELHPRDTAKSPTVEPASVIRHYQPPIVDQTAHGQSPPVFHTPDLNVSPPPLEYPVQAPPGFPCLTNMNRAMAAQLARQRRIRICRANKLRR